MQLTPEWVSSLRHVAPMVGQAWNGPPENSHLVPRALLQGRHGPILPKRKQVQKGELMTIKLNNEYIVALGFQSGGCDS